MSKAILVMDMPIRCGECQLFDPDIEKCFASDRAVSEQEINEHKSSWCPLKSLKRKSPSKLPLMADGDMQYTNYERGWNACIDEILRGAKKI